MDKATKLRIRKIDLPDEAFVDANTAIVTTITLEEAVRSEKAIKIMKRISYVMAALPFALPFGVKSYSFLKEGVRLSV